MVGDVAEQNVFLEDRVCFGKCQYVSMWSLSFLLKTYIPKETKNQEWDQDGQKICLRYTLASFCVAIKPSSSCMNLLHVTCTY